ncbi:hypothetical protein GF373_17705 [bacterium]|nr:hypothetical protein [bacterium]
MAKYHQAGRGRVFLQPYGAGPANAFDYQGCGRVTGFSQSMGDVDPVYCPARGRYDDFEVVDEVRGEGGLPTTSLVARFGLTNQIFEQDCPFGLQVHYGECQDPTNFIGGWDKILAFVQARFTQRSSDDLTALEPGERASILLTGDITAREVYEVDPVSLGEAAGVHISREVIDVTICDYQSCGSCGRISDGCQRIYAVTATSGVASPGLPSEIIYSEDGGSTWLDEAISTLGSNESPSGIICAGDYVIVPSQDSGGYHYAPISDLTDWTHITTGFVDNPVAAFSLGTTRIWFVGDSGYVYFTDDYTTGVEVQSDGTAAGGSVLTDIYAVDSEHIVAVGEDNTLILSENGGQSWQDMGGPAANAGVTINCIWMRTQYEWVIGTAGGELYYTLNAGTDWYEKTFSGSGNGEVRDVVFATYGNSPFGYMAHDYNDAGRIFRTLDGGNNWYLLPDGVGSIPSNDYIGALTVCNDPDIVVGGGLADDGEDGILVIG